MKIVAFNGSPRKKGNTSVLLSHALKELEQEGFETELVQLAGKKLKGCLACFKCATNQDRRCAVDNDGLNECLEKMLAADGIILGSPTYFCSITAEMKALIDRAGMVATVNGGLLKHKVGASVVAARRAGSVSAFNTLNYFFLYAEMFVPGSTYWNVAFGLEPGDVEKDEEGINTIKNLGKNMAWLLKKIQ